MPPGWIAASSQRARAFLEQPVRRAMLRGRLVHPYWSRRLHGLGENSILHKPLRVSGERSIAIGSDCLLLWPQLSAWPTPERRHEPILTIGDRVVAGPLVSLTAERSVIVGDEVSIGSLALVCDSFRGLTGPRDALGATPREPIPVRVGSGTRIGERVAVMPGASVGRHCVIEPGSIVEGDIPDYSIVAGAPARIVDNRRPR